MKTIITLTTALFVFFSFQTNAFSGSRLDGIDCGKRMSRLDADKCEQIRRTRATRRNDSTTQPERQPQTNPWAYEDGFDDATSGEGEWSDDQNYLDGYEDAQRQKRN